MSTKFLKIHPSDNVVVALTDLSAGERILSTPVLTLKESIMAKHKFTLDNFNTGDEIVMYGLVVGKALCPIQMGCAITTQNVAHQVSSITGKTKYPIWSPPDVSKWKNKTFMGYTRADGQVGTANYWLVIPLVFCENKNVNAIREAFEEELGYKKRERYKGYVHELIQHYRSGDQNLHSITLKDATSTEQVKVFENIDGIKFLTHDGGCGGIRQDSETLCMLLAGYIHNPNVAGATILSLGCQNAQVSLLTAKIKAIDPGFTKPVIIVDQQQAGTENELLKKRYKKHFWP